MAITTATTDLLLSLYELLSSVLGAAYAIVASVVHAAVGFATGLVTLAGDIASGAVDIAGGVGKFVLGNVVVLAMAAAAAFAYVRYTAQGRRVVAGKKML